MTLEELQLLLGSLPRSDNLHDGLEFRILPRPLCQHVNDRIRRRRLRWRWCLLRLRLGRRGSRLRDGLVLDWGVVVLIRALLVVVRPLAICRCLLLHLSGCLSRAVQADGKGVWFDDQLRLPHLRKVADDLFLSLYVLLVLLGTVGDLLRWREKGMEEPEVGA